MRRFGNSSLPDGKFQEILKLGKMLLDAEIPHEMWRICDGWQILYPDSDNRVLSAIEIMGLLTEQERRHDELVRSLTAENVFERIKEHYKKKGGKR